MHGRLQHHHPLRPHGRARPHPDPGPARHRGGAPSPDPQGAAHLGRPRRRDRRSARGPSLRLLAGYGAEAINPYLAFETLAGDGQGPARGGERRRSWSSATSRRSTRACSRSCRRWASRPTSRTAARRSSTRSACRAPSSTSIFSGTATPHRRRRPGRDRRGDGAPPRRRVRRRRRSAQRARRRRRIRLSPARRSALLDAADRCRCCSTRCAATARDKYDAYAELLNEQNEHLLTIRGLFRLQAGRRGRPQAGAARRGRVRRRRSSSASPPAPCRSARSRARRTRRWRSR